MTTDLKLIPQYLTEDEIEKRFAAFWEHVKGSLGDSLPLPLAVMAASFIPQIPKHLTDQERQQEILDFLASFAWCLGYSAVFSFAGEAAEGTEEAS